MDYERMYREALELIEEKEREIEELREQLEKSNATISADEGGHEGLRLRGG